MISTPTLFVLGAGASKDYRLPLGTELAQIIINQIASDNNRHKQISQWTGHSEDELLNLARLLQQSQVDTIDAWLEKRSQFIEVGKTCICHAINTYENPVTLTDGWYRCLWNTMIKGVQSVQDFPRNNKVAFITFNYDRSLEQYFSQVMPGAFNNSLDECIKAVNKLPILHIHGQAGFLQWQALKYSGLSRPVSGSC